MKNSLSARLTFRIMAVVMAMMAVIAGVVYAIVREYMLDEARERYKNILLKNHQELRRHLSDVYVAAKNNVHDIERDIDNPDLMFGHMERIISQNTNLACCALLFQQNYYPDKGRVFVPCARRDSAVNVIVSRIDSTYNSYFYDEWFRQLMLIDSADWTSAYFESHMFAGNQEPRLLTTYTVPIHRADGKPVAMFATDLSLEWLRDELMEDIQKEYAKYEPRQKHHSYSCVIDSMGTYLIHPDKQRMLSDTLHLDIPLTGTSGSATVTIDGVPSWIYYRKVKYVEWTMLIVVPEDVILAGGRGVNLIILLTMLAGLIAIYFICRYQIRKTTSPLHRFALSADQVALGNFTSPLPEVQSDDEVRLLRDAFGNMQTSLTSYVEQLQQTVTQKASLERDLKIANAIQMAMLPKTLNSPATATPTPHIDLYASLTPALDVGGDLYDYFLRDNRLFFCIGDVSGKGIPAALMMAVMRAMFRSETRRADSAAAIVSTMNHNLSEEYTAGYFVTMFVGILDLSTGHLDYCNAGHEAPVIVTEHEASLLTCFPNLPVGALPDWDFQGQQAQMHAGDMLFLYTDGLSEAENAAKQLFGRKHVRQLVGNNAAATARQLVEFMEAEVHRHVADAQQNDDITMLAITCPTTTKDAATTTTMRATMDDIACVAPFVAAAARQAELSDKEAKRLRLAVEEAIANIINHGEATNITLHSAVETAQTGKALALTITDDGLPFDPTAASHTDLSLPPDQRPPGGMGLILLRQMTDKLTYQRADGRNILKIIKLKS